MTERGHTLLRCRGLKKSYRGIPVVNNVHLSLRRNEIVGLLGPNGAGKTTCFNMLTGLVKPDKGQIFLNHVDISDWPAHIRARLGLRYLPQEPSIFRGLSVEDNVLAVLEVLIKDKSERLSQLTQLLEDFQLDHIRKSPATALSGGERRRLEVARALVGDPAFILLDEPLAGVDPKMIQEMHALIRKLTTRNIGVLVTDHNAREIFSLVDRVYIIYDGAVYKEGKPMDIAHDKDVRENYLGARFSL